MSDDVARFILKRMDSHIAENVRNVRERIARACDRASRDPHDITLVAITKTHPPELIARVIESGISDLGESKVQELESKIDQIDRSRARIHLVGHLQTNKAKKAASLCNVIQSVDSMRLADELNRHGVTRTAPLECLVQVNCSGESQKSGVGPAGAFDLIRHVSKLENLALTGVMTIGPLTDNPDAIRQAFRLCRKIFEEGKTLAGSGFRFLSMGMTDDFEVAIEEGSTMVRIGSALFGPRDYSRAQG